MSSDRRDFVLLIVCIMLVIGGGIAGAVLGRMASPDPDSAKTAVIAVETSPVSISGNEPTAAGTTEAGEAVLVVGDYKNGDKVTAYEWVDSNGGVYYSSSNPILNSYIGWTILGVVIGLISVFVAIFVGFFLDERASKKRMESDRIIRAALY